MILEHDVVFTGKFIDHDFEGVINYGFLWGNIFKKSNFDFDKIHEKEREEVI